MIIDLVDFDFDFEFGLLTFEALMSSSASVSEIDLRLLKADSRAVLQMR